jgi:hypothetical protein
VALLRILSRAAEKRSGYDDAGPATRKMQGDDVSNPSFLWVRQGGCRGLERPGDTARSCANCIRYCLLGIRAKLPGPNASELLALGFYLRWRASGPKVATPAAAP